MYIYSGDTAYRKWDYVLEVDENDVKKQRIVYFDCRSPAEINKNYYSLTSIIKNIESGSWKLVDSKFLSDEKDKFEMCKESTIVDIKFQYNNSNTRYFLIRIGETNSYYLLDSDSYKTLSNTPIIGHNAGVSRKVLGEYLKQSCSYVSKYTIL